MSEGKYAEPAREFVGASGEFVRARAARAAMAPSLTTSPSLSTTTGFLSTDATTACSVHGPSEPRDICAGCSNTICNSMVDGGGEALRDNGRVPRAAFRSLTRTRSLPERCLRDHPRAKRARGDFGGHVQRRSRYAP